jgi:hypothetical protein
LSGSGSAAGKIAAPIVALVSLGATGADVATVVVCGLVAYVVLLLVDLLR